MQNLTQRPQAALAVRILSNYSLPLTMVAGARIVGGVIVVDRAGGKGL